MASHDRYWCHWHPHRSIRPTLSRSGDIASRPPSARAHPSRPRPVDRGGSWGAMTMPWRALRPHPSPSGHLTLKIAPERRTVSPVAGCGLRWAAQLVAVGRQWPPSDAATAARGCPRPISQGGQTRCGQWCAMSLYIIVLIVDTAYMTALLELSAQIACCVIAPVQ